MTVPLNPPKTIFISGDSQGGTIICIEVVAHAYSILTDIEARRSDSIQSVTMFDSCLQF